MAWQIFTERRASKWVFLDVVIVLGCLQIKQVLGKYGYPPKTAILRIGWVKVSVCSRPIIMNVLITKIDSIGNLASAATVAASSFEMVITNPQALLDAIDPARFDALKGRGSLQTISTTPPGYVEPASVDHSRNSQPNDVVFNDNVQTSDIMVETAGELQGNKIKGKIQKLGDFIDTDAVCIFYIVMSFRFWHVRTRLVLLTRIIAGAGAVLGRI